MLMIGRSVVVTLLVVDAPVLGAALPSCTAKHLALLNIGGVPENLSTFSRLQPEADDDDGLLPPDQELEVAGGIRLEAEITLQTRKQANR